MRVLVCGGRDFANRNYLFTVLGEVHDLERPITCIIHGGAPGADALAGQWADWRDVPSQKFAADWKAHGRAAGPIRNQIMLDEGRPDIVIAFEGGRGTADMVRRAKAAGIKVVEALPAPLSAGRMA
jgi:hypothetical protein